MLGRSRLSSSPSLAGCHAGRQRPPRSEGLPHCTRPNSHAQQKATSCTQGLHTGGRKQHCKGSRSVTHTAGGGEGKGPGGLRGQAGPRQPPLAPREGAHPPHLPCRCATVGVGWAEAGCRGSRRDHKPCWAGGVAAGPGSPVPSRSLAPCQPHTHLETSRQGGEAGFGLQAKRASAGARHPRPITPPAPHAQSAPARLHLRPDGGTGTPERR